MRIYMMSMSNYHVREIDGTRWISCCGLQLMRFVASADDLGLVFSNPLGMAVSLLCVNDSRLTETGSFKSLGRATNRTEFQSMSIGFHPWLKTLRISPLCL